MQQKMSSGFNEVDWVRLLWKNPTRLGDFCINCTSSSHFAPSFMQYRNGPKCTQTLWNAPKHEFRPDGVDRVDLLQIILTQLCGLNFCINFNSSARFEPSIVKQLNGPKCTQTLRNKTKHKFSVQCGELGAFIVKNSDTTSWHELLH